VMDYMDGLLYDGMKRLTAAVNGVNGANGAYAFWFSYTAIYGTTLVEMYACHVRLRSKDCIIYGKVTFLKSKLITFKENLSLR
jgi:hypothetical protein